VDGKKELVWTALHFPESRIVLYKENILLPLENFGFG
jgi:hypothetical protein